MTDRVKDLLEKEMDTLSRKKADLLISPLSRCVIRLLSESDPVVRRGGGGVR